MRLPTYLPSSHFLSISTSIALAAGLVGIAYYITRPHNPSGTLLTSATDTISEDWQKTLDEIQAGTDGLPPPPDPQAVNSLLTEAQSANVTSSVARTLFVSLAAAGAEGLGADIPTQERLIADAAARAKTQTTQTMYTTGDLTIVPPTPKSSRQWGNAVMSTFVAHPKANNEKALYALGYALDYNNTASLESLRAIGEDYEALALDLSKIPVPQTLVPMYLQLIQNLSSMAAATPEMRSVLTDPLRGLAGLQVFQTSGGEAGRVLTTLAEQLRKSGILFTRDEAGSDWSSFLVSP